MDGYKHLAREQRYALKILLQAGDLNKTQIAAHLGVHKSTITRELQRNSDGRGHHKYNDDLAQRKYEKRMKQRPHTVRFTEDMKSEVRRLIVQEQYSPEQIHGRFTLEGNDMVCHETIYQWVYACKRRGDREMADNLRRRCKKYARRSNINRTRGIIKNRVDISQRPAEVDAKNRFGDLEIDTIIGKGHKGAIMTINDRCTSLTLIRKLEGKEAAPLAASAIDALSPYKHLLHTITADNGKEFAAHQDIAKALDISFFFAKPYHSWERGANENMNGLARQYIPKGTNFDEVSDEYVAMVQNKLNNRPRKRLGYLTPIEYCQKMFNFTP